MKKEIKHGLTRELKFRNSIIFSFAAYWAERLPWKLKTEMREDLQN